MLVPEVNFDGQDDAPTTIHMENGKPYTLEPEGVTSGLNFIQFHWRNRTTGKTHGPFTALGRRNLAFRKAEAEKAGYEFVVGDLPKE